MRYIRAYVLFLVRLILALFICLLVFTPLEHVLNSLGSIFEWAFEPLQEIRPDLGDGKLTLLHIEK